MPRARRVLATLVLAAGWVPPGAAAAVPSGAVAVVPSAAAADPLSLGTFIQTVGLDPTCPEGFDCTAFRVSCPGVAADASGFLATRSPAGQARGLVVLATGGGGDKWWGSGQPGRPSTEFFDHLREDGFVVVQLRWVDPWLEASPGEDAGSAHLACRPATVFDWVHDELFVPLDAPGPRGRCGFCLAGNSGGASQVSYALSHFGLDGELDAVIPSGGPPHAAQRKGCLRRPLDEAYWYDGGAAARIDSSYGFVDERGPCVRHDTAWISRWNAESVDTGGSDHVHPDTRVRVIVGTGDTSVAPQHGLDYLLSLWDEASPFVTMVEVPAPHSLYDSVDGLAAIRQALLQTPLSPCVDQAGTVCGTPDADVVHVTADGVVAHLGGGADVVYVEADGVVVRAGPGADVVYVEGQDVTVFGGGGKDRLFGGPFPDDLRGEAGDDVLRGGPRADRLDGGAGTDSCRGGGGADQIVGCED